MFFDQHDIEFMVFITLSDIRWFVYVQTIHCGNINICFICIIWGIARIYSEFGLDGPNFNVHFLVRIRGQTLPNRAVYIFKNGPSNL
jgi:hypothetical protein